VHAAASAATPTNSEGFLRSLAAIGDSGGSAIYQGQTMAWAAPGAAFVYSVLSSSPRALAAFNVTYSTPGNNVLGFVGLAGSPLAYQPATITSTAEFKFTLPSVNPNQDLAVAFLPPTFDDQFTALSIQVDVDGTPVVSQSFDDVSDATAFLTNDVIDIGHPFAGIETDISFQMTVTTDSNYGEYDLVPIAFGLTPEPSSLALLAFGGLLLQRRRRR
jgi:hypothetical protein